MVCYLSIHTTINQRRMVSPNIFLEIANHSSVGIMLYNIPGRTGVTLSIETVQKLSEHKRIVSIKEATGDLGFMARMRAVLPEHFSMLSGDDNLTIPLLSIGGAGVVSVVSNLFPASVVKMVQLWKQGSLRRIQKIVF
jgi:4-hydroxy-tetrahydrodipicolinate synthase